MQDMLGEALREVYGPLKDLVNRLNGTNGAEWHMALKKFLRKENPWATLPPTQTSSYTCWKTVRIGDEELDLVTVSVIDLGYSYGAPRKAIYDRAIERGLGLAPWELAEVLRAEYRDQPPEETMVIASLPQDQKPLREWYHHTRRWLLQCLRNRSTDKESALVIEEDNGAGGWRWNQKTKFVFVLARRKV